MACRCRHVSWSNRPWEIPFIWLSITRLMNNNWPMNYFLIGFDLKWPTSCSSHSHQQAPCRHSLTEINKWIFIVIWFMFVFSIPRRHHLFRYGFFYAKIIMSCHCVRYTQRSTIYSLLLNEMGPSTRDTTFFARNSIIRCNGMCTHVFLFHKMSDENANELCCIAIQSSDE